MQDERRGDIGPRGSPKRVRILSSINPLETDAGSAVEDEAAARQSPSGQDEPPGHKPAHADADGDREARRTKFRFKSKHSKSHHGSSHHHHREDDDLSASSHHRHHRHRHHRHKRRRTRSPSPAVEPPVAAEPEPEDPYRPPRLDPDAAFRESLFDAMADDEGAAYWQNVYGQPIHVYAAQRDRVNEQGELEHMTDDEYATYVRRKMWEKTHAGLLEERARRQREKEAGERKADEDRRIQAEVDRSLRRGEQRRARRAWRDRWAEYLDAWARWDGAAGGIPWPAESRDRGGLGEAEVRAFFVRGLDLEALGENEFAARLKEERVRWHPDKMQQRLGGRVDEAVMRDVTAIFQTIDKLWADTRASAVKRS